MREVLLHLNVAVPEDDGRAVEDITAAVLGAIEVGSDDSSVASLVIDCALAEEI